MIDLSRDDTRSLVAESRFAPSVHNIQPTRWRFHSGKVTIFGDERRSIPVADPNGRDWRLSHGAACEGMALAMAQRGLTLDIEHLEAHSTPRRNGTLITIADCAILPGPSSVDVAEPVSDRATFRGCFAPVTPDIKDGLDRLEAERDDILLVRDPSLIDHAARLADEAALFFLRDASHREELLKWMRLSASHPNFERDGLNARAMSLGYAEAYAAGLVLGPMFSSLDRAGVAAPLVGEAGKTRTASAIVLFHRPVGEDSFISGRAFYRAWLAMQRASLSGSPMSVLADWPVARNALHRLHGLAADRHIVSVFRIGRPKLAQTVRHARLPVDELMV